MDSGLPRWRSGPGMTAERLLILGLPELAARRRVEVAPDAELILLDHGAAARHPLAMALGGFGFLLLGERSAARIAGPLPASGTRHRAGRPDAADRPGAAGLGPVERRWRTQQRERRDAAQQEARPGRHDHSG